MDEPSETEVEIPNGIDRDVRLSQIQWIGLAGTAATFVGMFTPLYGLLTFRITMAGLGWPALVIGVASLVAAASIVRRRAVLSLGAGLVALGVALYLLIRTEIDKASMHDRFPQTEPTDQWTQPLPGGFEDMANAVVAPQWGWAVILLGISAILLTSVMLLRTGGKHARAAVPD